MNDLIRALADRMPEKILWSATWGKHYWADSGQYVILGDEPGLHPEHKDLAGITLYAVLEYVRGLSEEKQLLFNRTLTDKIHWYMPKDSSDYPLVSAVTTRMAVETLLEIS